MSISGTRAVTSNALSPRSVTIGSVETVSPLRMSISVITPLNGARSERSEIEASMRASCASACVTAASARMTASLRAGAFWLFASALTSATACVASSIALFA